MAIRVEPCGWDPTIPTATGMCCVDINDPTQVAMHDLAIEIATNLIWRLTGMQYGCCDLTVRPCKPRTCDPLTLSQLIYWDSRQLAPGAGSLGVTSFFPTLIDGQVYNISCGCPQGCCKCRSDCEFLLPGPVCSVTSVTVGGIDLDPADWRVYDDNILSFNSDVCPPCQDYNVDSGEVGSWSVTYTVGIPVPAEANLAAGLYAIEVYKSLVGDKSCGLPATVQQIVRPGMTAQMFNPYLAINAGLTGLPIVDRIVRALNPYQLTQPVRVWAPGVPGTSVRSQTQ